MALKFKGPLNEYREPRIYGGLLETDEQAQAKKEKWIEEDYQNLRLLCAHFGIADGPHQFTLLALELAKELVPCFQEKPKEGRPNKWDAVSRGVLAVEIERITNTGETIDNAANILASQEPWRSFLESWDRDLQKHTGPDPKEAIKAAYKAAKKNKFTDACRDAFKYHEATGTIQAWEDEFVSSIKRK